MTILNCTWYIFQEALQKKQHQDFLDKDAPEIFTGSAGILCSSSLQNLPKYCQHFNN